MNLSSMPGLRTVLTLVLCGCLVGTFGGCGLPAPELEPLARFRGLSNLEFSPDGKYFYSENQVRDTSTWKVVAEFPYVRYVREMGVHFTKDSRRLVLLNLGVADVYEVPSFNLLQRVNVVGSLGACLTPDQQSLATVSSSGEVQRWALKSQVEGDADSEKNPPLQTVDAMMEIESFDIAGDGSLIAVANESTLKVYRTDDLSEVANKKLLFRQPATVNRVCILPDNRRVMMITGVEVHVVSLQEGETTLKLFTFPKYYDTAACWCEQEQAFVIAFFSKTANNLCVQLFDGKSGESRGAMPVHEHPNLVGTMQCSNDGKWLVTNGANGGAGDMEVKVWDTKQLVSRLSNEEPKFKR